MKMHFPTRERLGKIRPDCRNRYSDCRNTRKTIFPTRIKIHAVIGTVRAARNGDRRISISVESSWRTYTSFDRLFPFRATDGFGDETRLEIIPLRNSRTIPSAKLIFQRRSCPRPDPSDGSHRSYPAGLTPPG